MSISHVLARCLSVAAAACSLLAATAPANAGVIAIFDPAFGPSIPNLGFRGTLALDVSAGCYALGSGFHTTGGSCQIVAQSGQINFYNATTNSNVLNTVDLPGAFFVPNFVFGAYFDSLTGQLAGLDTTDSGLFFVSVTDRNAVAPINYTGNMLLYFVSGFAPGATVPGVGAAFLVNCNPANQQDRSCARGDPASTSNPASVTFVTVPEPDSIALALLALGALAVTRRRAPIGRRAPRPDGW